MQKMKTIAYNGKPQCNSNIKCALRIQKEQFEMAKKEDPKLTIEATLPII